MKRIVAIMLVVVALGGCSASGQADDHKGGVKVEGNK